MLGEAVGVSGLLGFFSTDSPLSGTFSWKTGEIFRDFRGFSDAPARKNMDEWMKYIQPRLVE